ncbi:hypothetical protein [Escherichia coli]|uniref:hypothetical protein n=1 Tax=Escherichia coli TaxID=562 RepID=UPI001F2BA980|nr:hypothetical protein [Escherichia coli]
MIKAEVVFDGESIFVNGRTIKIHHLDWLYHVYELENHVDMFHSLEQAIEYCMEN